MAAPSSQESSNSKLKVKEALLSKAIKALLQVVAKRTANANPLFGASAETMTVLFTLSTIPEGRKLKPCIIELPHPMYDDKSEVCFISKDPQKQYKELLLQKHPVPGLTKVIGVDKLRRNYKSIEAKRALADAFDLFLCDWRVVEMMPKLLGTIFYQKKHKAPIPVRIKAADPKPMVQQAINGTCLRVPTGPCVGVKIGRCSMSEEELIANANAVIAGVAKHFSRNPLQSITVQATDAPALPVWRRPRPQGELLDLKKYHSDASSSAASDTGASGASETEATGDSEAAETLSTRDTISDIDTAGDTASEVESAREGLSASELDSEAGDVDAAEAVPKEEMPLFIGLKKKKRRRAGATGAAEEAPPAAMAPPPPPKKARKDKAAA